MPSSGVSAAPGPAYRLESFGLTDLGRLRKVNQDSFALRTKRGLFLVADGMGIRATGRIASRMAIDRVCEAVDPPREERSPRGLPPARESSGALLAEAIQLANRHLLSAAFENPVLTGMVSGFVGALFSPGHVAIAHVGDCRAYRLRGRRLEQLTEDLTHPFGLGLETYLEVDLRADSPEPGDVYLLCSDGLSDIVATSELTGILLLERDLGRAAGRFVQRANQLGGPDNITAVLLRVGEAAS